MTELEKLTVEVANLRSDHRLEAQLRSIKLVELARAQKRLDDIRRALGDQADIELAFEADAVSIKKAQSGKGWE